ncbi:dUTP diphosphatase [Peribacillus deserti]|uniref:dUTPase n=1 Tax=Peribacillus deserti TaxID=673318 RepID=A0A2N5MA24_9BACI|nr:dUTP diphosphatase [Peribacillus deserti]PLT31204.1 dUTPase [Peribacillus deserti]
MNYDQLFALQKSLDLHIETMHGLRKEELFDKKVLALLVEVGELANETRCFKFWSLKKSSPREVILEEYADGIHFILSLGITKSYEHIGPDMDEAENRDCDMTSQFLTVYKSINTFKEDPSEQVYKEMFTQYAKLGHLLGFSFADIETFYMDKNKVNYERQQQGY